MSLRMHVIISASFFLLVFFGFIMFYENYDKASRQEELSKHAEVISHSLWNFYPAGSEKYLQLAADLKRYEHILVKDAERELFLSVKGKSPGKLEQLLLAAGLIHIQDQSVDVKRDNKPIGELIVRFRHNTFYIYFNVFAILVLLFAVYILFFQTLRAKKLLEIRVENRTKELSNTVERLEKEGISRKRAEIELSWELDINKARADISKFLMYQQYNISEISESTLNYARKLTKSRHGFVSSIDRQTLENVGHTLTDMMGDQCTLKDKRIVFPIGEDGNYPSLWGYALNTGNAFFTNQPENHPAFKELPKGHISIDKFLAVPVMIDQEKAGLIALANPEKEYTDRDIDVVERIAKIYALALQRYRYELDKTGMEKQIRQMQKLEAIGTLAGGIAHDFNNILFPIVGFAEMLKDDLEEGSNQRDSVNEILIGAKRAKGLVKQILTFSRQVEQDIKPLSPQLIIKEVAKLVRSSIPSNIGIKKFIDPKTRTILADPTQLHQVAMNLVTNAYHAMEESGGVLTIKLQNIEPKDIPDQDLELKTGPHVLLSIEDTGAGIDKAALEKIFNPYFTTKKKGKGTGLGLSVVHGIVSNSGGDIHVESSLGQGTRFEVYFPAYISEKEDEEGSRSSYETPGGNERILLVDDEKQILLMEQMALEKLGYKVELENNSLTALDIFEKSPDSFDLIISDMAMPNLTGDRFAQKILKIKPDMPIIICTGFSDRTSEEKLLSIGVKALLMKPVAKLELAKTIRKVLDEAMNNKKSFVKEKIS